MSAENNGKVWAGVVGVYLAVWIIALIVVVCAYWPKTLRAGEPTDPNAASAFNGEPNTVSMEVLIVDNKPVDVGRTYQVSEKIGSRFLLVPVQCPLSNFCIVILAAAMGGLGACLHGANSLAYHRGRGDFSKDWVQWYFLRPLVGGVLALIFYLIIAAGFMPQVGSNGREFYGIIGLSGLIGLFSKQALNKLSDIFDAIFSPDKDGVNKKAGKPGAAAVNPMPQLDSIAPTTVAVGAGNVEVSLKGKGFIETSVVKIADRELKPTYKSAEELTVTLPLDLVAQPGDLSVAVFNPEPQGGTSKATTLTIE
jgi:hypothetical protein